jgi:hypothetical protein
VLDVGDGDDEGDSSDALGLGLALDVGDELPAEEPSALEEDEMEPGACSSDPVV